MSVPTLVEVAPLRQSMADADAAFDDAATMLAFVAADRAAFPGMLDDRLAALVTAFHARTDARNAYLDASLQVWN